ncbi:MAG: phage baseplate protein [Candidatus Rokubacteria bacterium]|nr:phage baseplate protein [Candidatus Rokubacteria bacterium]
MRTPPAAELLGVWERAVDLTPVERLLAVLAAADPDASWDALADLTIGERDVRLLAVRERLFGSAVAAVARCPACAERVELALDTDALRLAARPPHGVDGASRDALVVDVAGHVVHLRLPTSVDLLAVSATADVEVASRTLLARCVVAAHHGDVPIGGDALPEPVRHAVVARMAEADPAGDVELALVCPGCGGRWHVVFDAGAFLWSEIDAWALRTIDDVHVLATAYGWSEADVLALGPRRRRQYLALAEARLA